MEKTMAWFWGIYSFIPSHMAASIRVNFLETGVDKGFPLFCGSACEERKKSIQSSTKRNMDNFLQILQLIELIVRYYLDCNPKYLFVYRSRKDHYPGEAPAAAERPPAPEPCVSRICFPSFAWLYYFPTTLSLAIFIAGVRSEPPAHSALSPIAAISFRAS